MPIKHNKQRREEPTNNSVNNSVVLPATFFGNFSIDGAERVGQTIGKIQSHGATPSELLEPGKDKLSPTTTTAPRSQKANVQSDYSPKVTSYKIYRETMNRLSVLDGYVREGKYLEEALQFARFVLWSGVVDLCNYYATSEAGFKVSGANLQTRAKQLQTEVQDRYLKTGKGISIEFTELQKVNHKLDLIAGKISQLSPPKENTENAVSLPAFQVIQGGVS